MSLSGSDAADFVEDASHAADALISTFKSLRYYYVAFATCQQSAEKPKILQTQPLSHLLRDGLEASNALRRDFDVLQRKAQRTATLVSL